MSSFVKVLSALGFMRNDPQGEESAGTPTMQSVCCFPSVTLGRSVLKTLRCFLGMLLHTLLPPAKLCRNKICMPLSLIFQSLLCYIGPATLAVKCQLKPNEFNSSDKFKLAPTETMICLEFLPAMDH